MIPGTKKRPSPFDQVVNEKEMAHTNGSAPSNAIRQQLEPSARHYSRRDLFTNLPGIFGEGLTKLLRTSNHLQGELKDNWKPKKP